MDKKERDNYKILKKHGLIGCISEEMSRDLHKKEEREEDFSSSPSLEEKLEMLDDMIRRLEELPPVAMGLPISHYDLLSMLLLIASIFKAER